MSTCLAGTVFSGPIGVAGCAAFCAAACAPTAPACFQDNAVALQVKSGSSHAVVVQDLTPGQHVLTLSQGHLVPTKVLRNQRSNGTFAFTELIAQQGNCVANLTVTDEHNMVRLHGSALSSLETSSDFDEDSWEVSVAHQLKVGDWVPVMFSDGFSFADGCGGPKLARISEVRHLQLSVKNTLVTESGTVLANGMFTTTICDGDLPVYSSSNFSTVLQAWHLMHQGLETGSWRAAK